MSEHVRINFARPIPVFPLRCTILLPHTLQPLRIFERQYRQMVDDVLDGPGLIAMACYANAQSDDDVSESTGISAFDTLRNEDAGDDDGLDDNATPALRPAVCIGHIVEHERVPGGQHIILLQGVCRATIRQLQEPDGDRLYRTAMLSPLEQDEPSDDEMSRVRSTLDTVLRSDRLMRMRKVQQLIDWLDKNDVPTVALLEMLSVLLIRDDEVRYHLLAEPDPHMRADYVLDEVRGLYQMIGQAEQQSFADWPKGMSWN